jgi:hypothetical protein
LPRLFADFDDLVFDVFQTHEDNVTVACPCRHILSGIGAMPGKNFGTILHDRNPSAVSRIDFDSPVM